VGSSSKLAGGRGPGDEFEIRVRDPVSKGERELVGSIVRARHDQSPELEGGPTNA